MTAFVIDCSVAVTLCLKDEATPASDGLLDRLGATGSVYNIK